MKIFYKFTFAIFIIFSCEEETYKDCDGIIDGISREDNCGICDSIPTNDCVEDCAGVWGGENICGCTDSNAYNYNSSATFDDGSCDTSITNISFVKNILLDNYCASTVDIKQTEDGGYIIAGCKDNSAWLMKTNSYGEVVWEQSYGLGDYWGNRTVIQTSDGGYLFAGWEGAMKVDANGVQQWIKTGVPNNSSQNPYYEDALEHSNGNYYLVGGGPVNDPNNTNKGGQALLVKVNPNGQVLKTKFYGGNCEDDLFRSIIESNDGKLIMVGERGHGNGSFPCSFDFRYWKDIWVVKTGANGNVKWDKTYGGDFLEKGMDIASTDQEGYVILGQKCQHGGTIQNCESNAKVVILNIDEDGNSLDETLLSGLYFYESGTAMSLASTQLRGFVFVTHPRTGGDIWLRKWGGNEETKNDKLDLDFGFGGESIYRTSDNGFIISTVGGVIIKTDPDLNF